MTGITVSGRGEAHGTPDVMRVSIGVSVTRRGVAEAVRIAAERASNLIEALRVAGVAPTDVQTTAYAVGPHYEHQNGTRRLVGFRVDNSVVAAVHDVDRAGEILDTAAAAAGDNVRIDGMSFDLLDDDALVVEARRLAWADAKAKADQLASLAGVELGAPTSITEGVGPPQPMPHARLAMAAEASTPLQPGAHTVAVDLSVTFAIASGG